jgi:hypothetical protein
MANEPCSWHVCGGSSPTGRVNDLRVPQRRACLPDLSLAQQGDATQPTAMSAFRAQTAEPRHDRRNAMSDASPRRPGASTHWTFRHFIRIRPPTRLPQPSTRRKPRTVTSHTGPHRTFRRGQSCRLRTDQRGAATAELVVAMPLLLLLILAIAQFALWAHATHIAQAAAAEALSAARVSGGTTAAGNAEADRVLAQLGSGPLHNTRVSTQRDATRALVSISGTAANIVPFLTLPVDAEAVGPLEKFTPAGAAP